MWGPQSGCQLVGGKDENRIAPLSCSQLFPSGASQACDALFLIRVQLWPQGGEHKRSATEKGRQTFSALKVLFFETLEALTLTKEQDRFAAIRLRPLPPKGEVNLHWWVYLVSLYGEAWHPCRIRMRECRQEPES